MPRLWPEAVSERGGGRQIAAKPPPPPLLPGYFRQTIFKTHYVTFLPLPVFPFPTVWGKD